MARSFIRKPIFQRRHYVAIANVMRTYKSYPTITSVEDLFAELFRQDNSQFDIARWREACNTAKEGGHG